MNFNELRAKFDNVSDITNRSARRLRQPRTTGCCPRPKIERKRMIRRIAKRVCPAFPVRRGSVFVEYILLVTIVGIGVIVGLASVREALVNELVELANAINAITP